MSNITANQKFGALLPIVLVTYFMILFDVSVTFTATVKIAQDLNLTQATLAWVSNAYSVTFGSLLMFSGRAGDLWGRKRLLLVGLGIFGFSSLMVGLATSAPMIIGWRAIQGIGAAILAPTTLGLMMDFYEGEIRQRAIAAYAATIGISASLGLVLGGLITDLYSWRGGFFVNLPIAIILMLTTSRFIGNSRLEMANSVSKMDWPGTLLSTLAVALLIYGLSGGRYTIVALGLAGLLLLFFIWIESRSHQPLMPLKIFANFNRSIAYLTRFFFMGGVLAYWFLAPQAMQNVYHYSPLMAGVAFVPLTLAQFLTATFVTRLSARFGDRLVLIVGIVLNLIGLVFSIVAGLSSGYFFGIAIPMILMGAGQGLAIGPMTVLGLSKADNGLAGAASGLINTVHKIGGAAGLSIVVALSSSQILPTGIFSMALWWMLGIIGIALIVSAGFLFDRRSH